MKNKNKEKSNKTNYVFTKETLGVTLMLFSALVLLMLFTRSKVFAGIGVAVCTFMYGTFGYGSLLLMLLCGYAGVWLTFGKKFKISLRTTLAVCLTLFCAFLLFHTATTRDYSLASYGEYIKACYENASAGYSGYTFGGVISAIIVYPFARLISVVGSLIVFSLLTVASGYLLFVVIRREKGKAKSSGISVKTSEIPEGGEQNEEEEEVQAPVLEQPQQPTVREVYAESSYEEPQEKEQPADSDPYSRKNLGRKIMFDKDEFAAESYRRNMIFNEDSYFNHPVHNDSDYLSSFSSEKTNRTNKTYSESFQEDILNNPVSSTPSNYVFGDKPVNSLEGYERTAGEIYSVPQQRQDIPEFGSAEEEHPINSVTEEAKADAPIAEAPVVEPPIIETPIEREEPPQVQPRIEREPQERADNDILSVRRGDTSSDSFIGRRREEDFDRGDRFAGRRDGSEERKNDDAVDMFKLFGSSSVRGDNQVNPDTSRISPRSDRSNINLFDSIGDDENGGFVPMKDDGESRGFAERPAEPSKPEIVRTTRNVAPEPSKEEQKVEEKPKHIWKKYVRPGLDLLDDYPEHNNVNTGEIEDNKRIIVETLAKFKIDSNIANVVIGPAVTRYDVVIEDRTKITQSLKYKEAIAMQLMKDNVTAYLNYSKGALSIEVPNNTRTVVGLKGLLASPKFINCKPDTITFALGKNVDGEATCPDITKMPHLLVAGTTGSGKSICLSTLIISLLYKYSPEQLRFILVDPKQVEFIPYDKLPHLMINEIIHDVDKSIKALNWAIKEMDRRYNLMMEMSSKGKPSKSIDEYNANLPEGEEKLPKIVIILDEFGDLMMQAKKDIEGKIIRLGQKSRACGIHLILATQRPSVDCITGLIKSNLPTRIGFKVNSFDDSRTIFDSGGAEKLLGKGDMYFRSAENPELVRIQGCFISSNEVQRVTDFVKANNETYFDQSVSDFINKVEEEDSGAAPSDDGGDGGDAKIDETYIEALKYCIHSNQASVSMIQRRFPVGYIKACKIIDWMENMNYVTHSEGSKPRKVLLSKDEFVNIYGELDD